MKGKLHPIDETTLREVEAYIRRKALRLGVGDLLTVKIGCSNNNRLTFHSSELRDNDPLRDERGE